MTKNLLTNLGDATSAMDVGIRRSVGQGWAQDFVVALGRFLGVKQYITLMANLGLIWFAVGGHKGGATM